MKGVTERQSQILAYTARFRKACGYSPSIREVGLAFGINSLRGVTVHLDALERKGYVRRIPGVARGLVLTASGRAAATAYQDSLKKERERDAA
jgi:SOS-response transcriptional repressor LexA